MDSAELIATDRSKTGKESIIYSTKDIDEPKLGSTKLINEKEDKDDVLFIEGIGNDVDFIPLVPKSPAEPIRKYDS